MYIYQALLYAGDWGTPSVFLLCLLCWSVVVPRWVWVWPSNKLMRKFFDWHEVGFICLVLGYE